MADEPSRSRLGRGLAALMGDAVAAEPVVQPSAPANNKTRRVPIEQLRPNPRNPRRTFAEAELEELAASIRERGIIQPIIVRSVDGAYEIIAGERRWRAAQRAQLHDVPVVTIEASDQEALELAIIENIQRADLNALEEAQGYQGLIEKFKYSHEQIAKIVGKSRPHVVNTLRLLQLPDSIKAHLLEGRLTAGHARAILGHPFVEALAEAIIHNGFSVREAERLAREMQEADAEPRAEKAAAKKSADTRALEKQLTDRLGLRVTLHEAGQSGQVRISYASLDQLDALLRKLSL